MKPERILGIDPGTRIVGYCLLDIIPPRRQPKIAEYGVIKTVKCGMRNAECGINGEKQGLGNRLKIIYEELTKLIKLHKPTAMAIENVFYARDVQATVKIGEGRAIAILAATQAGIPLFEYSPAEVKKSVTGNGRADKTQVAEMVKHILGLAEIPQPADASDAIAIALCHTHRTL